MRPKDGAAPPARQVALWRAFDFTAESRFAFSSSKSRSPPRLEAPARYEPGASFSGPRNPTGPAVREGHEPAATTPTPHRTTRKNPADATCACLFAIDAIEGRVHLLMHLGARIEHFQKTVNRACKEALDQPDYGEAVQFFKGFARGLSFPQILNRQNKELQLHADGRAGRFSETFATAARSLLLFTLPRAKPSPG